MSRTDSSDTDILTVLVRCVRICCPPEFLEEDPSLAEALVSLLKSEDTEPGLLKAVTTSVAKLTHGASVLQSHSLMAAVPRLFHLAEHRGREDSRVEGDSVVRSLCLYCMESVNRVRMREGGGCAVLVSVLAHPLHSELRDTVLRSLLQFLYDNHSLNVLMSEGLVPCLINMLDQYMKDTKKRHLCTAPLSGGSVATSSILIRFLIKTGMFQFKNFLPFVE